MGKEDLRKEILEFIKSREQLSIKYIAEIYNSTRYISRREVKAVIKDLIQDGVLVKVDDIDCFGEKVDYVVISNSGDQEGSGLKD